MYCENCGKFMPDNARFCGNCGNTILQSPVDNNLIISSEKGRQRKSGVFFGWIIVFILVICSVIGVCFVILWKNGNDLKNVNIYVETDGENHDDIYQDDEIESIIWRDNEIIISPISVKMLEIQPNEEKTVSIGQVEVLTYNGNLSQKNQTDTYTFTAQRDGRYRFEISNVIAGVNLCMNVYNEKGEKVSLEYGDVMRKNGDGHTIKGLIQGEVYTIKITQRTGFSDYTLKIYQQKESMDISTCTQINDSIEFTEQRNVYFFTVPCDGRYRFEMSGLQNGTYVSLYAFNELGEVVDSNEHGCNNGKGITLKELEAGKTYEIQVRQNEGTSNYTLLVGHQKEYVDISDVTLIKDSIEYTDQRNVYQFTVPIEGLYRFEMAGMHVDARVKLYVFNELYETVASQENCKNGDGVTLENLVAGSTYEVQVIQAEEMGDYELKIGRQKPVIDVFDGCIVKDSIEFCGQENIYQFIPEKSGSYVIEISGMNTDFHTKLSVLNNLEEILDTVSNTQNGSQVLLKNAVAGQIYTIENKWSSHYGEYTLDIYMSE